MTVWDTFNSLDYSILKKTLTNNFHFLLLFSYLFFAILFILSLIFWKERVIAFDAAYQVYNVIRVEGFAIQEGRFGAAIVQILPLVFTKMGASLNLILQSYSTAFVLYPLLLFTLASSVFKNTRMGFSIVLFFLLMQVHTFYWIQSELIQGCVFSLFFISLFSKWPSPSIIGFLGYVLGIIVILYAHPLAIVALLYGMGYLFLDASTYRNRTFWGLIMVIIVGGVYKYYIGSLGGYDTKAFGLFSGFSDRIGNIFSLTSTKFFVKRLLSTYYFLAIAMLAVFLFFIKQKKWLKLLWVTAAVSGWLVLILTTYHWGGQQFYIESFYLMLGLFIVIPISWDLCFAGINKDSGINKWIIPSVLFILIIVRIAQIWEGKRIYQERLAWMSEQLETMNTFEEQRFYIHQSNTPMHIIQLDWAVAYEMILLSSLNGQTNKTKTLYIMKDSDNEEEIIHLKGGFKSGLGISKYNWLGKRFKMDDELDVRLLE